MKGLKLMHPLHTFALGGAIALAACFTAGAQTTETTTPTPTGKAVPAHAAKTPPARPARKVAPARGAARTATATAPVGTTSQKTQLAAPMVAPASSQTMLNPSAPGSTAAPSNAMTTLPSTGSPSSRAPAGDSRAPVEGQGVGTFVAGRSTLTAYGCFRNATRVFCDFDAANQSSVQWHSNIWGGVRLVDDGGKITARHNAFFMGDDGSQLSTAFVTPDKPVRFIMEYDNVDQRYTSVSLVNGREQIQAVPITANNASQPGGTMPGRGTASAAAPGTKGTAR